MTGQDPAEEGLQITSRIPRALMSDYERTYFDMHGSFGFRPNHRKRTRWQRFQWWLWLNTRHD